MRHDEREKTTGGPPEPIPDATEAAPVKTGFPWRVAGGGALALALIWFVIQNSHSVQVNLFWWSGNYPMILLLAGVAVAAIVVWEALALLRRRRRKRSGPER